jgi:hypothetical protein
MVCISRESYWIKSIKSIIIFRITDVFIDNSTLFIQNVRPEHRGRYKCSAYNLEGKGESNEVMLDVRCERLV